MGKLTEIIQTQRRPIDFLGRFSRRSASIDRSAFGRCTDAEREALAVTLALDLLVVLGENASLPGRKFFVVVARILMGRLAALLEVIPLGSPFVLGKVDVYKLVLCIRPARINLHSLA
jgi:hypothetical protein